MCIDQMWYFFALWIHHQDNPKEFLLSLYLSGYSVLVNRIFVSLLFPSWGILERLLCYYSTSKVFLHTVCQQVLFFDIYWATNFWAIRFWYVDLVHFEPCYFRHHPRKWVLGVEWLCPEGRQGGCQLIFLL